MLSGQAAGLAEIVKAAGGDAAAAVQLLYVQQLPELLRIQTEALKQVHFGDITLIGGAQEGQSGIANVLKELTVGMASAGAIGDQLGIPFLQKLNGEPGKVAHKAVLEPKPPRVSAGHPPADIPREIVEVGD